MVKTFWVSQTSRHAHRTVGLALQAAALKRKPARIEIAPGRYEEPLRVNGDVELVAAGGPGTVTLYSADGPVIESRGRVQLSDLVLVGSDNDAVRCATGTMTIERSQIQGHSGVSVHAVPQTTITLRDSLISNGRVVFAGATGLVERCELTRSSTNGIAAIRGADVRIQDSRIEDCQIHGVLASSSRVTVVGCRLTGTGNDSLSTEKQATLDIRDCHITASHQSGVTYRDQSTGLMERTVVSRSAHGVVTHSGARPIVRECVFEDCHDTGINANSRGLGRFENCEVVRAGNVAVFATTGGSPEVDGCRITGGHVGIALIDGRGQFSRCEINGVTAVALRVWQESTAHFTGIRVDGGAVGLDAVGPGGTNAVLTDTHFRNIGRIGASILEQARVTLRGCTFHDGLGGISAGGESQLFAYDCHIDHTQAGGAIAYGKAAFTTERLTVAQPGAYGLAGQDSALLDVKDSEFTDTRHIGITTSGSCAGQLLRCTVTGDRGSAVVHNGLVQLNDLRSSLPVTERAPEPPPEMPKWIVNYFNGPVFNAAVYNPTLHQGDLGAPAQEGPRMPDDQPQSVTNYNGPVINSEVRNSPMFWNNNTVNFAHVEQVAPGFEEVARVVGAVLTRLGDLGLPETEQRDAAQSANEVLAEVAKPEPDRGVVRRGLNALKGVLLQLTAGLLTGANAGAVELGNDLIRDLGHITL